MKIGIKFYNNLINNILLNHNDLPFMKYPQTRDALATYVSHVYSMRYTKEEWDTIIYPEYLKKVKEITESYKTYTGIGSRETPNDVLYSMTLIAEFLKENKFILRSGGADGADTAFEEGAGTLKQIFIPWKGFNNRNSQFDKVSIEALNMAKDLHPAWLKLSQGAQKLHGRNCYQILGSDLNKPSSFVICYTKGGKGTGGTGQALRLAKKLGIKIFDYGSYQTVEDAEKDIIKYVEELK